MEYVPVVCVYILDYIYIYIYKGKKMERIGGEGRRWPKFLNYWVLLSTSSSLWNSGKKNWESCLGTNLPWLTHAKRTWVKVMEGPNKSNLPISI